VVGSNVKHGVDSTQAERMLREQLAELATSQARGDSKNMSKITTAVERFLSGCAGWDWK
jgi:hypothetical protein